MNNEKKTGRKITYTLILILIVAGSIVTLFLMSRAYLEKKYRPLIAQYLAANLSVSEKRNLYEQISKQTPSLWDTLPEPLVGRIAKPNTRAVESEAEIRINNAGLRASHPFVQKPAGVYRIVCLGDSFVYGEAGKEEDRWCDQLQQWFVESGTRMDGKTVETVAIGLPSWTMLQEATYLTSRLSDYDPDLILVLTVPNDITDDSGVTGAGLLTGDFSTSERQWGSGTLSNVAAGSFGLQHYTALTYDDAPTAAAYWGKGMAAMKRLSDLQQTRGGKVLFSVLNEEGKGISYFENVYRKQFTRAGISAPQFSVTYLKSIDTMLTHDSHPNRYGHQLLFSQYLYAMAHAGILVVSPKKLPKLDEKLVPELGKDCNEKKLARQRRSFADGFSERIDFTALTPVELQAFLGGILPERGAESRVKPWASIRAGFIIKPAANNFRRLVLEIELPDRAELFPLQIMVRVHNKIEKSVILTSAGSAKLVVPISAELAQLPGLEVMLESNHYFTQIDDARMKVFRLVSAHWE